MYEEGPLIPVEKVKSDLSGSQRQRRGSEALRSNGTVCSGGAVCTVLCGNRAVCRLWQLFFLIWGVIAAFCAAWGWILTHKSVQERIPRWIRMTFCGLVAAGILLLLILEGMIFGQFGAKAEAGADYVIILGAQWKTTGPSYVLQKRLDKAIEYLNANPETKVIVSGGQGYNEPVSEAEGMKGYLADAGIDPERILAEDASTNTTQNLIYSGELLNKSEDSVVVVTNNFHMFRALAIAKKQGYLHVEGLSAGTFPLTVPNNLLREAFGIVKDFMANNL